MRAQAQRSSAANRDGSAPRGSVFGSRDDATRASSRSSNGSGALSHRVHRVRVGALALAIAALALLAFVPLAGAKEVSKFFGTEFSTGGFGGEFSSPRDIAVNTSGVGAPLGTLYVADDANHRIQRFDRNGRFVSAWGKDVIASSVNERQRLFIDPTGGTFSLTFNGATTGPIDAINVIGGLVESSTIDNALDALSSVGGDANVSVSGGSTPAVRRDAVPFYVTFTGALAGTDFAQMAVDTGNLEGTARIATLADGRASVANDTGTAFEICTVATECKAGVASGGDATRAGNGTMDNPQSVAVDNDTGNVYVSDRDNRRINAYDASGNFLFSVGRDVKDPDGGTAVEVCSNATDTCRAADTGAGPGEIATTSTAGTLGMAVSPPDGNAATGSLYLADSANQRIQQFDLAGNFLAMHGYGVTDGGATGTGTVTVGSRSVTAVVTTSKAFSVGQTITGTGIDPGTTITAVGAGTITLSIAANAGALGAGTALTVTPGAGNVSGDEQQTVTLGTNTTGGTFRLTYTTPNPSNSTGTTANIAFNAPATGVGSVQEALENLASIAPGDVSVTGSGGAGGVYTITFQGARFADTNVTQMTSTATGLTVSSGTKTAAVATIREGGGPESCTTATPGICRAGLAGAVFGQFGSGNPTRVAVDSRGILYASDSNNGGELDRFDSLDANGGGRVFLASIPASVNEVQRVSFPGLEFGDTIRLTCPNGVDTENIIFNSGPADSIRNALAAACGAGTVHVTTDNQVTFQAALGSRDLAPMSCQVVAALVSGRCNVTTVTEGRASALLAGSTAGLAVDPDSDAGGADEDALYALRGFSPPGGSNSGDTAVQQFGSVNDPGLTTAPSVADAVHGSHAGMTADETGLGLDDRSGRLYVSSTRDLTIPPLPPNGSEMTAHRVYILEDSLPAPAVNLSAVTTKTDTTATFSAGVDPRGGLIKCAFQYATDFRFTDATDVAARDCSSFNPDSGFQAVGQRVDGLTPNTHYYVRLKVTRTFDASAVATSGSVEFDTDSVPPVISDIGAIQVGDTSARLVGTIDPRNSVTGYHFEYGTTPDLGTSTASFNIGGGSRLITISQVITGLAKDTDYFFRLVATNEFGTTNGTTKTFHTRAVPIPPVDDGNCPNAGIRAAQGSGYLQSCRAYEMISPPEKNQGGVDQTSLSVLQVAFAAGGGGNAAAFCTNAIFGDAVSGTFATSCGNYVSRRTGELPTGWETSATYPPYCIQDSQGNIEVGGLPHGLLNRSFDVALKILPESSECFGLLDPAATDRAGNLYRLDPFSDPVDAELISTVPPQGFEISASRLAGGSDDFSHAFYMSPNNQTPEAPAGDSPPPGNFVKLYEWIAVGEPGCASPLASPSGCLRLASVAPDGRPLTTNAQVRKEYTPNTVGNYIGSMISRDGRRAFFHSPVDVDSQRLYVREDGSETIDLGTPECAVPADCGGAERAEEFLWASDRGDVAFFTSNQKLTDASASEGSGIAKLYRWERDNLEGERLTDIGALIASELGGSPPTLPAIVGASEDGSVVYAVNGGSIYRVDLGGGGPVAQRLGDYLFYELEGSSRAFNLSPIPHGDPNVIQHFKRVSADGRYLAITTPVALDPAADRDADLDAYRWGAGEGWTCVSCQLPGAPSAGSVDVLLPMCCDHLLGANGMTISDEEEHRISEDGKRVFFTAKDALVPGDVNGEAGCPSVRSAFQQGGTYACDDVYEWNDGTLSLVSSGAPGDGSSLIGADASGENVAFVTHERLVGWDFDNGGDLYTARIGGGFPEPAPAPPGCDLEAGACEGAGTVAADIPGAGTRAFESKGDPILRTRRCPRGKRKVTRNGRTRCVPKKRKRQNRAAKHNRRAAR